MQFIMLNRDFEIKFIAMNLKMSQAADFQDFN